MPRDAVIICGTPRSGSSLLCGALRATRLCGRADEFFERQTLRENTEEWSVRNRRQYVKQMLDTTTPNGVFSIKVHWHHMNNLRAHLQPRERPWRRRQQNPFVYLAPRLHFVFLSRRDKVRQAVSYQRAMITRRWHAHLGEPAPDDVLPHQIDVATLRSVVQTLHECEGHWKDLFERVGIKPLELFYEDDLEVGYERAALRVLDSAGIDRPRDLVARSNLQRQRDEWSEAVAQIYKDLEHRGFSLG